MAFSVITQWNRPDGMVNQCVNVNLPEERRAEMEAWVEGFSDGSLGLDRVLEIESSLPDGAPDTLRLRAADIRHIEIRG